MKSYFITNIVPKDILLKDYSQAANNFCWNLIDAKCFDYTCVCLPINISQKQSYPKSDNIFDIQCRIFPHFGLFRYIHVFIENLYLVYKIGRHKKVWFYNITSYNIVVYLILKFLLQDKVFIILADFTPPTHKISLQSLIKWAISKSNGIISLSSRTDFTHKNMAFLAGILPEYKIQDTIQRVHEKEKRTFLFSGELGNVTGLPMAIEVFKKVPEAKLYITGNGDSSYLYAIAKKYPNIEYLGYLPYKKYLDVLSTVDICLNFRNPALPENRNNFPSKVIEFFSWNKVVLSTIDYPELKTFKYLKVAYQEEDIKYAIRNILSLPSADLEMYQDNKAELRNNFSESVWYHTIRKMENSAML